MRFLKKTNKLYYDKYVYKVETYNPLSTIYRERDLGKVRATLNEYDIRVQASKGRLVIGKTWSTKNITTDDIFNNIQFLTLLEAETSFAIRVEGDYVNLYTNNKDLVDQLCLIGKIVREVVVPKSDKIRDYLLSNPNKIVVSEYTHKYKVGISGLGLQADSFIDWAENMPKVKLCGKKRYIADSYFYVTDDKVLGLCRLFLGKKIRRIDELVTESEI